MSEQKAKLVIIRDGMAKSIVADCVTYGGLIVVMWFGVLLESAAMQWFAFIFFAVGMAGKAMSMYGGGVVYGFDAARKRIDALEREAKQ